MRPARSLAELTAMARAIATEISLERAALRLQRDAATLVGASEALLVIIDWPRGTAFTMAGPIRQAQVLDLVTAVAGSGKRSLVGPALLQPIGPAPARAVLALRKPDAFTAAEVATISALASGLAPSLDRLIRQT